MFYIEKNDKPLWIERMLNLIRTNDNIIKLPITEKTTEKQILRLATKTARIIRRRSNSKKVVLSKKMKEQENFINLLINEQLEIQDGKWLFEILLPQITEYVIEEKKIEKSEISVLINDVTEVEIENIKKLARKYKTINIVTNHREKFQRIEKDLNESEGIILTVANNKRKSLLKSQIILNIDFPTELINKYNINDNAILVNVKIKANITKKRFEGTIINDYEIDYRDDLKENEKFCNNKYWLKDIYEANIYKRQRLQELENKIKVDGIRIVELT